MSVPEKQEVLVVNGCALPRMALYDLENESWYLEEDDVIRVGVLPTTQTKWGKVTSVRPKTPGTVVEEGRSLAFVEAKKFVGRVNARFKVEVLEANRELLEVPHLCQSDPYGRGWIVEVRPLEAGYRERLRTFDEAADVLREEIRSRGIMCFREVPDVVMAALGVECSQALLVLADAIRHVPPGQVIHLVAEADENAEREVRAWARVTGNELLEFALEGRLAHALIKRRG
ncbi:MAG: hypothetical protein NZ953_00085 [Thaumarchaeota archaeon]|nr:hypothetical protein [Candidatus Calditenuaceae archaeon]MCX8203389.1 hypothetical protein [Nitrososphaeria archaeon]MDW8042957.1 hypothetical protein [Nitrososphaerota archaeon]